MIHAPLRGLFLLGRAAAVVAVAAAVPYIIKKNRKVAEQIGDSLIKAGENLRGEAKSAAAEPKTQEPVVQSEKPKAKAASRTAKATAKPASPKSTAKPAAKSAPKRPAAPKKKPTPKPKPESPKE